MKNILFSKKFWLIIGMSILCTLLFFIFSACGTSDIVLRASKDASTYNIDAIYNHDTKMLYGLEKVNYINNSNITLDHLALHLYPNAFRSDAVFKPVSKTNTEKAYPNGFSSGFIEIKDVKVGAKAVNFEIGGVDKNILIIPLANALQPKSVLDFSLEFDIQLPNVRHRFGYTDKAVNLGNWYPIMCGISGDKYQMEPYSYNGDPFFSDIANYNVSLSVDEKFVVAHTGKLHNQTIENGKKKLFMQAKAVRDFALSLSSEFKVLNKKADNTMISYYYYGDKTPEKSLDTSVRTVQTFNKEFGVYPYSTLAVVETGFLHGGMEYPNIVFIADNLEKYEDYTNVIVHEIAHQWWYGVVGDNEVVDGWLDEGLAEYSTAIFYDKNPEYELQKDIIIRNTLNSYLLFIDVYKDVFEKVDTTMTRKLTDYKTEPEYTYMAYVKSVLMLHTLEDLVGEKKFTSSLQNFYKANALKNVDKTEFIKAFENTCHMPLEDFFDSWLNGKIIIENP